jgi:DUF1680 family protein
MAQCRAFSPGEVSLRPGIFQQRFALNRAYVMSLTDANLLRHHYTEAGFMGLQLRNTALGTPGHGDDMHWGWESPTSQIRGHFLGHWLSAAARICAAVDDHEVRLKADRIISELARCQEKNGGEWVASIPEKYLHWTAQGKPTWAPQYVVQKTLMGLYDMVVWAHNDQALDILQKAARWFHRWTGPFSRQQMDDILDVETGGMLELWANLYGITGKQEHLDLVHRYDRPRLFEPLLQGRDMLTNKHANTTIPEAQGAARAWEVTAEERWRRIAEAYWKCAVTDRGAFCTGGQTSGEIWTPPFEYASRLGDKNQEHCTVFNMMRLADYLFRWTGDVTYADYIERNLYNGILAQQHPRTGMVSYFLPLEAGGKKVWGTPTYDFWCCHGSLVQAHTLHNAYVYYSDDDGFMVCQYIPSELHTQWNGILVTLALAMDDRSSGLAPDNSSADGDRHRPSCWAIDIAVSCRDAVRFSLQLRMPWWLSGKARITVNGTPEEATAGPSSFHRMTRIWKQDTIHLELPKSVTCCPIPDEPDTVAFLDGPVVLAGLCSEERLLAGGKDNPSSFLVPDNEREWSRWLSGYRTVGQQRGLRFRPLHEIVDEPYTVYFPTKGDGAGR